MATLCVAAAVPASAGGGCTAPADLVNLGAPLPKLLTAVRTDGPVRIVALGSSSTWGAGASSRAHSYPARLERELKAIWPKNDVQVINAGVNGQLARDMVQRIGRDVAPHKPLLVIWQTGVNDAIKGVPIEDYTQLLRTGIEKLRALGADVVLIDQQFYPRFQKLKNGPLYLAAMREVALKMQVPVVQRYRIMQHLIASAQFTTATLLAPDQFHLNDQSYDCMGRLLAQSLRSAAALAPQPVTAAPAVVVPQQPAVVSNKDEAKM